MPGMGANSKIFEKMSLSESVFELHFLEWLPPYKNESLDAYIKRINSEIMHPNPVLIGVSFGGIIVQEIAKIRKTLKTIIISSVRSEKEFPKRMKLAQKTSIYKLFPTAWIDEIESIYKKMSSEKTKKRINLFNEYMTVRDQEYLDWAFHTILHWENSNPDPKTIHIHGDKDEIFPIQYIQNAIVIEGGTHAMILIKHKWFTENLPKIILENEKEN